MIEELKILAEILKGVTDGALIGAITYMVLAFLKSPVVYTILGVTAYKVTKLIVNRPKDVLDKNSIEVERL